MATNDKLRAMAAILQSENTGIYPIHDLVNLLREAADTIEQQRDELRRANERERMDWTTSVV